MKKKVHTERNERAIVLLSGGIDSTTTLYCAKKQNYKCHCLIFDYGQKHKKEIKSAKKIAKINGYPYYIIKFNLPWHGSSLIDSKLKIPIRQAHKIGKTGVPSTYVPARNTVFISFALSLAETIGAETVFIGANAIDFSGYPDCRPEYYRQFNKLLTTAIPNKKIRIQTPLLNKTKSEIIKLGQKLNVPFELTWSCYSGKKFPCEKCDSCILRARGFRQARIRDPLSK